MSVSDAPARAATGITGPLSFNQEFLCAFDKGEVDGAFGRRHTLSGCWRWKGPLDVDVLAASLADVVERHQILRTVVDRQARVQTVVPSPAAPSLEVRPGPDRGSGTDRDAWAEALLNDVDAAPFDVAALPLLRAVVARFDDGDAALVLSTHHVASDAWSLHVILRDLVEFYRARTEGREPSLPPAEQYLAFAEAQGRLAGDPAVRDALDFWRANLEGAGILAFSTDRPRADGLPDAYGVERFVLEADVTSQLRVLARSTRTSPFMVLLAAYAWFLRSRFDVTDVLAPTFSAGRTDERFAGTVGPFFNFLPVRMDLAGVTTFREVLDVARTACLEAYRHEVPFALVANENPQVVSAFADPGRAVAVFEVLQPPALDGQPDRAPADGIRPEELRPEELRRRVTSQRTSSAIPDGLLWALDVLDTAEVVGSLKFNQSLFDLATIQDVVSGFQAVVREVVSAPDRPLSGPAQEGTRT